MAQESVSGGAGSVPRGRASRDNIVDEILSASEEGYPVSRAMVSECSRCRSRFQWARYHGMILDNAGQCCCLPLFDRSKSTTANCLCDWVMVLQLPALSRK
jgi:hypothetical protein